MRGPEYFGLAPVPGGIGCWRAAGRLVSVEDCGTDKRRSEGRLTGSREAIAVGGGSRLRLLGFETPVGYQGE